VIKKGELVMKTRIVLLLVVMISAFALSACGSSLLGFLPITSETTHEGTNEPIEVVETLQAESESELPVEETEEPNEQQALSFEAVEYIDEQAGIKLFHPVDWSVMTREKVGERGSQAALLSSGSTLEQVAENGARITPVLYNWDPKNDLDAFVAQRELAWEASGFEYTQQGVYQLEDGRKVIIFFVQVGGGNEAVLAFTTAGEEYLQITGEGDLDLCEEIVFSLASVN